MPAGIADDAAIGQTNFKADRTIVFRARAFLVKNIIQRVAIDPEDDVRWPVRKDCSPDCVPPLTRDGGVVDIF